MNKAHLSKPNLVAIILSIIVTAVVAFTFQQVIFHPFYVDVSGCPRVVPDNDLLFECFPEFKEVSRFPVYIIVFLVVPALIFAIIKGIYFLAHLFKKHAE